MRQLILLAVILVPACATTNSELIRDAHESGDWTALNQHLETEAERGQSRARQCGRDRRMWCKTSLFETTCACVDGTVSDAKIRAATGSIRGHALQ